MEIHVAFIRYMESFSIMCLLHLVLTNGLHVKLVSLLPLAK